jgi:hypothetical protein
VGVHSAPGWSGVLTKKRVSYGKNSVQFIVLMGTIRFRCPGSRWYGKTKQGEYVGECAARKAGDHPVYGKSCGSACN